MGFKNSKLRHRKVRSGTINL